jgi:hypothetical protein
VVTDEQGHAKTSASPFYAGGGFGPSDIQSAYQLPVAGGKGRIVALIGGGGYANAESDLAVYRQMYNLPACSTANGCFEKVDQHGGTSYPPDNPDWDAETALDLDMASAACPDCSLLLVLADSSNLDDLGAAVDQAAKMGAFAISNSYGFDEDSSVTSAEAHYTHPGILITASTGDNGTGPHYPATGAGVLAVGGTSLSHGGGGRGWTETAWSGGGSACSGFIAKPFWQNDTGGCTMRVEADVSAVADPMTGVAVYEGRWGVMGGTSVATPLVAGAFALLGVSDLSYPWKHPESFNDVTSGSNGSCSMDYVCNAGKGYDGPTGWGTPIGSAIMGGGGGDAGTSADSGTGDAGADDAGTTSDASGGTMDASGSSSGSGSSGSGSSSSGSGSGSSGSGGSSSGSGSGSSGSGSGSSGSGGSSSGSGSGSGSSDIDGGFGDTGGSGGGCSCAVPGSPAPLTATGFGVPLACAATALARRRRNR